MSADGYIYDTDALPGGPFTPGNVLISYDGPRLYWLNTQDDRHVLVTAAEETDQWYTEILRYYDTIEKTSIDAGQLDLYGAYKYAPRGSIYVVRHELGGTDTLVESRDAAKIPDAWLAEPGTLL